MMAAMRQELTSRSVELENEKIQTVYFGGGTPSLLSYEEIMQFFEVLQKHYNLDHLEEITLEANPDDFSQDFIYAIEKSPINRLSIGIQSFFDEDLAFMNRVHSASQADRCVKLAQDKGIDNITIDLIYAIPSSNMERWKKNVAQGISLHVPHISSYCMTIEEKTTFGNWERKGRLVQVPDEKASSQYLYLVSALEDANIHQYEISNFAKSGFESKHNSNYWTGIPYLGVGPSAHSFNGKNSRRWNVSNNISYMKKMMAGEHYHQEEVLTPRDRYNETIMTSLRTKKGVSLEYIKKEFHLDLYTSFQESIEEHMRHGLALLENKYLRLTPQGLFVADKIASDLFLLEEKNEH